MHNQEENTQQKLPISYHYAVLIVLLVADVIGLVRLTARHDFPIKELQTVFPFDYLLFFGVTVACFLSGYFYYSVRSRILEKLTVMFTGAMNLYFFLLAILLVFNNLSGEGGHGDLIGALIKEAFLNLLTSQSMSITFLIGASIGLTAWIGRPYNFSSWRFGSIKLTLLSVNFLLLMVMINCFLEDRAIPQTITLHQYWENQERITSWLNAATREELIQNAAEWNTGKGFAAFYRLVDLSRDPSGNLAIEEKKRIGQIFLKALADTGPDYRIRYDAFRQCDQFIHSDTSIFTFEEENTICRAFLKALHSGYPLQSYAFDRFDELLKSKAGHRHFTENDRNEIRKVYLYVAIHTYDDIDGSCLRNVGNLFNDGISSERELIPWAIGLLECPTKEADSIRARAIKYLLKSNSPEALKALRAQVNKERSPDNRKLIEEGLLRFNK